ncbi:hypothetical protein LCGC14_2001190 [marine sediment metagenome]|uniref:Uncharacterized protein n=1 Tax=marine sediment metagenome TaxID=412755 RepID=A0A0F9F339_9ZZZZ
MNGYVWKAEEIGWAMAVAGAVFVFELLSRFEAEVLSDPKAYGVAALAGLIRAVFGAGLAVLTRR